MSYFDRLRECRYKAPSGAEFSILFDDLERSGGKKAAVHELPHRDIADVQDLGNQAEHFPMALYFIGVDYDRTADAFYEALREKGRGTLKHPRWGDRTVLPITRSQSEGFVDKIRCAHFQVDFVEAPDPASLTISTTTAAAVAASAQAAAAASSASMAAAVTTLDVVETSKMKASAVVQSALSLDSLLSIAAAADEVRSGLSAAQHTLERDIDALAADPLALTDSMTQLLRMPADIEVAIVGKVAGYASLITDGIAALVGLTIGPAIATVTNLLAATVALAESTAKGTIKSRGEAIEIYDLVTESSAEALAAVEGYVSDSSALAAVQQLASDARARLLVESYSLPTERTMILQGDSDPITLATRLYGDPERYQDVIDQNGLADDLIFAVPAGMEIHWYE